MPARGPTDGPALGLRADDVSLNDGDSVQTRTDAFGNGNNATDGTAAIRPTYWRREAAGQRIPGLRATGPVAESHAMRRWA